MKRRLERNVQEKHYYKEVGKKVIYIEDADEQMKIDTFMKRHSSPPARTAYESGYSVYMFNGNNIEVNTSMVQKKRVNKNHFLISRAPKAPNLPISCLASAEHVVAMQGVVEDFESEFEPKTKQNVMYLIQLSCNTKKVMIQKEKMNIMRILQHYDDTLNMKNVSISYNKASAVYEIRTSTQVADIQLLVRALSSEDKYEILDCDFEDIGLNEGVCLVKKDASNPIHALVNIANADSEKGFLERDAGTTSGLFTATYQDTNWTFNFFRSLDDMREKTDYPQNALAIKIFNSF